MTVLQHMKNLLKSLLFEIDIKSVLYTMEFTICIILTKNVTVISFLSCKSLVSSFLEYKYYKTFF